MSGTYRSDAHPSRIVCFVVALALAGLGQGAFADEDAEFKGTKPMLQAGAAALQRELPGDVTTSDLNEAVRATFAAMRPFQWQPIETAPTDREILLGLADGQGFRTALGHWEVHDEPPFDGGRWTATVWWGAEPTHWLEIPPPPD